MTYDVVVLGAGPGGYEAAIRCAQYGLNTALVEARELGGTCLNRGCIPTKALIQCAHTLETIKDAAEFGIEVTDPRYVYERMIDRKDDIVSRLRNGIAGLEKSYGVTVIRGFGVLKDAHTIDVEGELIRAEKIILATGSAPVKPPIPGADGANILTSDEVLELREVPDSLIIIGGGVIGTEFATLFSMLGKKVTVLEMMPEILPGVDGEIVKLLRRTMKKRGITVVTNARVTGIGENGQVTVDFELDEAECSVSADCCVLAVGRRPQTAGIGLETVGVRTERGFVEINGYLQTSIPNIYAIGDVTGKVQLAHVATAQGLIAAAHCAGKPVKEMHYDIIPSCIYTEPEIACVGITEEQAKESGRNLAVGRFNTAGNGRCMTMGSGQGLVKILSDADTGEILGAHLFSPRATDMIAEIAAVMRCEGTIYELAETIHPHPTVSESILEAVHDAEGLCCNALPQKKK